MANGELVEKTINFTWKDVWSRMDSNERQQAVLAFANWVRSGPESLVRQYGKPFLRALARHVHFRIQTIDKMPTEKLAQLVKRNLDSFFDARDWKLLFQAHYMQNKNRLMCRFLDLCGIEHDERGGVDGDVHPPEDLPSITQTVLNEFGQRDVTCYYMVLRLHHPETWGFVDKVLPGLLSDQTVVSVQVEKEPNAPEDGHSSQEELAEEFTQLDRVLIDQIIVTAAGEERGLTPEELLDLVETVHALDTRRSRTYFHLGFMDALLTDHEPDFDRPEMNDARRQWYLAGVLAGYGRQRNLDQLEKWITDRRGDFDRAAKNAGGAGASMAKTVFGILLESTNLVPAIVLLKGQLVATGPNMRWTALEEASNRLRCGDMASAKALLSVLHDHAEHITFIDDEERIAFCSRVHRKLGQTYQAAGELIKARSLFQRLLEDSEICNAELLADMGLVESGFSSLQEVRIEGDGARREMTLEALRKGEHYFCDAVERFSDSAHHAYYALALLRYFEYMDERGKDEIRVSGVSYAESALAGMIGSDLGDVYDRMGITGQCRFVIAMLRMAALDASQVPAAKHAWDSITVNAGQFPLKHLRRFLECAELVDRRIAVEIAESIWRIRGDEVLDLFHDQEWVIESRYLRDSLLEIARDTGQPGSRRFDLWAILIPAAIRAGDAGIAEEGLDSLESLAQDDSQLAERFVNWLDDRKHYDPIWDEADVMRAKYRVLTRLGKDPEAFAALRELFFAIRDRYPDEALQVLELFSVRQAPSETYRDLIVPDFGGGSCDDVEHNVEQRLIDGASVRVLFIGGNEIQAQYDESIKQRIQKDWPGISITFEHTGWSSNWGREISRLKKLAEESDVVVLMSMMRTMLGRTLRNALNDPPRPWVPCTGTGRKALESSIRKAAVVAIT